MDARNLPGSLKIAILVQSLGPETSQFIMGSLTESEKNAVATHINQLGNVSPDLVEKIAEEFFQQMQQRKTLPAGTAGSQKTAGDKAESKKGS